jgi:WD40 repeat protein/DNA-binding SARP family transcriptional activator
MEQHRLEFRILGPLRVQLNGTSVPLGGPKQRALLALLLLSANRVVSRDRLIGELFVEQSVNSAEHALRNQVWRLRKVLNPVPTNEPRLVARAPGYLLRVEPGELDLERFEGLVADGRESLAAGDGAAAARSFRAAEALWDGRPLADLEFEPGAGVEVERLEELRLAAVEERIDAELALGKQLALVSELETLAIEHPFRERFRVQLMLALYRSGRQAEGLEVYRRTRAFMNDELGLEPGGELQQLERAILVQDPALDLSTDGAGARTTPARDVCPFKGLAPFEAADAEFFFGRERLVEELVARTVDAPLLAIVGPSGSGKSSLVRAGLLPAIETESLVVRPGDPPAAELAEMLTRVPPDERLVLAVDQFEDVFAATVPEDERGGFIGALVEAAWDPDRRVRVVIALRADFFGQLAPYVALSDLVAPNQVLLGPMSQTELRRAITRPAERTGLEVESALVDALVDETSGEAGALPLLSTALLDLWREREGRSLTLASYEQSGGIRGAVGRYAEAVYRSLNETEQLVARGILLRLVAGGDGQPLMRRRVTRRELDAEDEHVASVLAALVEQRLLVADNDSVELIHEALIEQWPRLVEWLREDVQGRAVHRHLTQAATEWEARGRDPGELYRGARLAAALDWADAAELNRVERQFLDASRTASARTNRRLKALLALAVLLLAAALVAGAIALVARDSATRAATSADAERLGAQALADPNLDRSLLLAREGVNLDDSTATRSNLLTALMRSPAALAVLHGHDPQILDQALSSNGRLLALRGNNGDVSFFDTKTLREVGQSFKSDGQITDCGAIVRPVRALAFSPDGHTLAVGDWNGVNLGLHLLDGRTHLEQATQSSFYGGPIDDVAYAPDGHTLVTGEATSCRSNPPPDQLTLRRPRDGTPLRLSPIIPGGRLIGFTRDSRLLLVTSGETTSYLLDAHTFARVRTFHLSGAAAVSPVSDTAAYGQDDGTVELLDLQTGAVRQMNRRATGQVIGVGFSRDGQTLATTSDDGSVDVWDVPTASLRETFIGHSGSAVAPTFSPDGATLYTASNDGTVIVWDLSGLRRLGRPFRFDPTARPGEGPHQPTQSAAIAVAFSPDSEFFATSPGPSRVTLWRASDLTALDEFRGPTGDIQSIAFSHDGHLMAATGSGPDTVVWNTRTRKAVKLLGPAGPGGNYGVNFSSDDRLVGTAGGDGVVRLYDVRTGRLYASLVARGAEQDLDFSSDGLHVAAAGLAGDISIWDLRSRRLERTISHGPLILAIRYSPNGKQIATGDLKGNVDLWDAATGRRVGPTLGGQNGSIDSVTYSPSGDQVMTTSSDGKFRLWDLKSGKLIGPPLPGADTDGWGTFSPNGKYVIATFRSGIGVIWSVDPATWRRQACRIAHRTLTPAEWHNFLPDRGYRSICR